MATIVRGKRKGTELSIKRCGIERFQLEDGTFVAPSMLQLSQAEANHAVHCPHTQGMVYKYEMLPNLTFKKRLLN